MITRLAAIALWVLGAAFAVAQAPAKIYYDVAHGEAPPPGPMADLARKLGFSVSTATGPITPDALAGSRLVYLRAPSQAFAAPEKEAIVSFVQRGGSLLLVLDEERRQSLAGTGVNDILAPLGLKLTDDTPYLHNCGGVARAGEINKGDRELPFSGGRAVEGGTPFAWQLDAEGKPAQPFAAFNTLSGGGRVVVMGEGMASLFLGDPAGQRLTGVPRDPARTTFWGRDSLVFMEEVFTWLLAGGPAAGR